MNNVDFHTKNENQDLSRINFRCPCCSKLYSSDPSKIYVEEPEYTCSKCDAEFSISLLMALQQTEVVGVELEDEVKTTSEIVDLPVSAKATESVVKDLQQEFNFEALEKGEVSFNEIVEENFNNSLDSKWDEVLGDYENRKTHNKFIEFCKKSKNLEFAIDKYAKLIEVNHNDKIASSFLQKMEIGLESKMKFKVAAIRAGFFTRPVFIAVGVVCFGLLLIAVGSLLFQNKNIAGLGIGLIFFTFAARAFFQPRHL